jgi:hypothetical protein
MNIKCMAFDAALADRIREALPRSRAISERKMFGGLAFLMNMPTPDGPNWGVPRAFFPVSVGAAVI